MFYRYPQKGSIVGLKVDSLEPIAVVHTAGAFLLIAFIIMHIYLMTTGTTLTSNLKAMLTGYEEIEEDNNNSKTNDDETNTEPVIDNIRDNVKDTDTEIKEIYKD